MAIAFAAMLPLAPATGPCQTATESAFSDALAPLLVSAVESVRDGVLAAPNQPLPADVGDAFRGHVADRLLRKVRWRVDDGAVSVQRAVFLLRDTPALTADYVIVFATAEDASRMLLWAHELYHVVQYDAWGVDGFVTRYLADYESIEHEANEFVWRWRDATR